MVAEDARRVLLGLPPYGGWWPSLNWSKPTQKDYVLQPMMVAHPEERDMLKTGNTNMRYHPDRVSATVLGAANEFRGYMLNDDECIFLLDMMLVSTSTATYARVAGYMSALAAESEPFKVHDIVTVWPVNVGEQFQRYHGAVGSVEHISGDGQVIAIGIWDGSDSGPVRAFPVEALLMLRPYTGPADV